MLYNLTSARNSIIHNYFKNNPTLKQDQLEGLSKLIKLGTDVSTQEFLVKFREPKNIYPIINKLCKNRNFLYNFRGEEYRANRYKEILKQLLSGKDTQNKSYFTVNQKSSICNKINDICNDLLKKTYQSKDDLEFIAESKDYKNLILFNKNLNYTQDFIIKEDIQNNNNSKVYDAYIKIHPKYACLNKDNENSDSVYQVSNQSTANLKKELLRDLGLNEEINIFGAENIVTDEICNGIKQLQLQLQQAVIKIQSAFRGYRQRKPEPEADEGVTTIRRDNDILAYRTPNGIIRKIDNKEKTKKKGGSFKRYVGVTEVNKDSKNKFVALEIKNVYCFNRLKKQNADFNKFYAEHRKQLPNIIPQYRVNENMIYTRFAGDDLFTLIKEKRRTNFNTNQYIALFENIDFIHSKGYKLQDIKLENAAYNSETDAINLFDMADMFCTIDNKRLCGTPGTVPHNLFGDASNKQDVVCSFIMLMSDYLSHVVSYYDNELCIQSKHLDKFINNCIQDTYRFEFRNFIRYPKIKPFPTNTLNEILIPNVENPDQITSNNRSFETVWELLSNNTWWEFNDGKSIR